MDRPMGGAMVDRTYGNREIYKYTYLSRDIYDGAWLHVHVQMIIMAGQGHISKVKEKQETGQGSAQGKAKVPWATAHLPYLTQAAPAYLT